MRRSSTENGAFFVCAKIDENDNLILQNMTFFKKSVQNVCVFKCFFVTLQDKIHVYTRVCVYVAVNQLNTNKY